MASAVSGQRVVCPKAAGPGRARLVDPPAMPARCSFCDNMAGY